MSLALEERPAAVETAGRTSGGPARRALFRWSWRLFRREWRQQLLVLALVTFSVAATTVGVALAVNASQPNDSSSGTANSLMTFAGKDHADIAAAQKAFGPVEEIAHQSIPVPGSLETLDLRAQDPNGKYSRPTLRLLAGRFPTGAGDVAMTRGAAATLGVKIGDRFVENGHTRRVIGLVENPLSLGDDFALVAPGQANPPARVTILFDAAAGKVAAFQPSGQALEIGTRGARHKSAAAAAVLALETIGLLFVGLVAAAGFAVMAQRRLRALGMLGALGATDRHVRLAMVANGAVVGVVGAVSGAVVGLITWIALAPRFEKLVKHRIDRFHLPWWAIATAMGLAVLTAITAAWWPARAAARASIVRALSGRPAPPKPAHRFAGAGGFFLAIGVVCLAFADRSSPNAFLIIAGTVATTFGMLFLGPLFIRALTAVGRRAPIALRLALRDLARYQARSAAALGAISLALAIAATVAISAAALAVTPAEANLAANQAVIYPDAGGAFVFGPGAGDVPVLSEAEVHALQSHVDALAASLHARSVVPLTAAVDPASGTFTTGPDAAGGGAGSVAIRSKIARAVPSPAAGATEVEAPASLSRVVGVTHQGHSGFLITDTVPLYVATPALLRHFGIKASEIDPNTDIISSRSGLEGLVVTGPGPASSGSRGPYEWHPTIQRIKLPTETSAPGTLLTEHALHTFGLKPVAAAWFLESRAPLTTARVNSAQHAAGGAGLTIETRSTPPSYSRLRNGATAIGLLVALGVLAMTVGLIRSETANDLRTLAAAGATSTTRRTLTGATAGALALLGALLGTGGAYVALLAWHRSDLHPLTQVPVANLATIIVGLPLIAIIAGWLLAGREPAAIAHQPLE